MVKITSMNKFKGVDKVEKRIIIFGFKIHNAAEIGNEFR